jgi:hypothetical protein
MDLEERFNEFVRSLQSAELVDEIQLTQIQQTAKKADFFFDERQIIGEMKTITKDMEPKAKEILEKHQDRDEYPIFYDDWEPGKILAHLPDGKEINAEIFHAITSGVEDGVEKANRQIRKTKEVFDLSNSEGILIILNDLIGIMSPNIVAHKIGHLFNKRTQTGEVRYPHISLAWIISEIHILQGSQEQALLPSIVILNNHVSNYEESDNYVKWLQKKWASFNNMPLIQGGSDLESLRFSKREEKTTPKMIRRSEAWKKDYHRRPYLRGLTDEKLFEYAKQINLQMLPGFINGLHKKPSSEVMHQGMENLTHLMEEMNHRGLDYRNLSSAIGEVYQELRKEGKL